MNLKMDLSRTGLDMFFKGYRLESLKVLWESSEGLLSSAVWEQVNQRRSQPISRASIINSLNDMVENGVLQGSDETGKGGHRTRYKAEMNEPELKRYLAKAAKEKLDEMM